MVVDSEYEESETFCEVFRPKRFVSVCTMRKLTSQILRLLSGSAAEFLSVVGKQKEVGLLYLRSILGR
jgi:hypothetical protein